MVVPLNLEPLHITKKNLSYAQGFFCMAILFIQTGGTIDKDYPRVMASYTFEISKPIVKKYMRQVKPSFRYRVIEALKKDSLDITNSDRKKIAKLCLREKEKHIIITHGTDTMVQTAQTLDFIKNKTIVLTGAMLPAIHVESDALFNIGTAVGAIDYLGYGVFIAMSGKLFPWKKCIKSRKTIKFIAKKITTN